jgi:hypothetical protein
MIAVRLVPEAERRRNPVLADIARRAAAWRAGVVGLTSTEKSALIALFGLITDFDRVVDDHMTYTQVAMWMFGVESRSDLKGSQRQAAARGTRGLADKAIIIATAPPARGGRGARFRVEFPVPETAPVLAVADPVNGQHNVGSSWRAKRQDSGRRTASTLTWKRPRRSWQTDLDTDVSAEGDGPPQETTKAIVVTGRVHPSGEVYSATSRVLGIFTRSATRTNFQPVVEELLGQGISVNELDAAAARCEKAGQRTPGAFAAEAKRKVRGS